MVISHNSILNETDAFMELAELQAQNYKSLQRIKSAAPTVSFNEVDNWVVKANGANFYTITASRKSVRVCAMQDLGGGKYVLEKRFAATICEITGESNEMIEYLSVVTHEHSGILYDFQDVKNTHLNIIIEIVLNQALASVLGEILRTIEKGTIPDSINSDKVMEMIMSPFKTTTSKKMSRTVGNRQYSILDTPATRKAYELLIDGLDGLTKKNKKQFENSLHKALSLAAALDKYESCVLLALSGRDSFDEINFDEITRMLTMSVMRYLGSRE